MCYVKSEIKLVFCIITRVIPPNYNPNNIVYGIKGGKPAVTTGLLKEKDQYNVEAVLRVKQSSTLIK